MRTMLVVLMALCLVSSLAIAKPAIEKPVMPYDSNSRATEVEPNDTFGTANTLTAGDDMNAGIIPAAEVDWFAITVTAGLEYEFETHPGDIGDTKLYIFDTDGTTQLAYVDDGGVGYYSYLTYTFAADGTYFVEITGYSSSTTGTYILTATEGDPPPPPPANDTCADAEIIPTGAYSIDSSTTSAAGDYSPTLSTCTGYGAAGNDLVYVICLGDGETFDVTMTAGFDDSIYLVLDCEDIDGTCVAGADAYPSGSTFTYTNASGSSLQLYLIVDGYGSTNNGDFNIAGVNGGTCDPVGNESMNWGSVKAMFE